MLACTAERQSSFARTLELEAGITKEEEPLCTDSRAALRGSTQRTKRFFVASLSVEGSTEGIALLCRGLIVLELLQGLEGADSLIIIAISIVGLPDD